MIHPQLNKYQYFTIVLSILMLIGVHQSIFAQSLIPNRMTKILNGYEISMVNDSVGFASVSGSGYDVSGGIYKLEDGIWKTLFTFPYSDAPQIKVFGENSVFMLHHQTHFGNWKYVLYHFDGKNWDRLDIPLIPWDETDYVIINDIDGVDENNLWLVGQKAAILHFKNGKWQVVESPIKWRQGEPYFAKDYRAVLAVNNNRTLLIGNQGLMVEAIGTELKQIKTPRQDENLTRIRKINDNRFLISSDKGSLYEWNGIYFKNLTTPLKDQAISDIEVLSDETVSIVQSGKLFRKSPNHPDWEIMLDMSGENVGISSFTSVGINQKLLKHYYFITIDGLYQTDVKGTVNFREVSKDAGIMSRGRRAIFFEANNDGFADIYLQGERGLPDGLLLNNGKGLFSDYSYQSNILNSSNGSMCLTIGDIDHDFDSDIIKVDAGTFKIHVLRNTGNGIYSNITEWSGLSEVEMKTDSDLWGNVIKLVDVNFDGDPDLIYSSWASPVRVFINNGIGQFTEMENFWLTDFSKSKKDKRPMGISFRFDAEKKTGEIIIPFYIDSLFVFQFEENLTNLISRKSYYPGGYSGAHFITFLASNKSDKSQLYVLDKNNGIIVGHKKGDDYQFIQPDIRNSSAIKIPGYPMSVGAVSDFDLDGNSDLMVMRHLYLNVLGQPLTDVMSSNGIQENGNISSADFDNDGDYDFVMAQGSEFGNKPISLFRNQLNHSDFVHVELRTISGNSFGIGSRIEVYPNGYIAVDSMLSRIVVGENETSGSNNNYLKYSLSTVKHQSVSIVVRFTDGTSRTFTDVKQGELLIVHDYAEPMFTAIQFSVAVRQIYQYINFFEELIRWLLLIFFMTVIYKLIGDTTLKTILLKYRWWIAGFLSYYITYYLVVQEEGLLYISAPPAAGLITAWLGIGLSYFYQIYVRTNYIGPYKIEKLLGEGSAGKVFMAYSSNENQHVAIKLYHEKIFSTKEGQIRFQREVAIGSSLNHPGVIHIFGSGQHNKSGYLVMELVEGINLREMILKELSVNQIVRWGIELAEALEHIHSNGMLHRDVKTENIIAMSDNKLKLMDLGLAKTNVFATMTRMGTSVGTLAYMSPQQAVGMPLDQTSDFYSLGVVMYELLSGGTLPISGENEMAFVYNIFNQKPKPVSDFNDQVSSELEKIVMRLLAKQPEDRYQTEKELIRDLGRLLGS